MARLDALTRSRDMIHKLLAAIMIRNLIKFSFKLCRIRCAEARRDFAARKIDNGLFPRKNRVKQANSL